MRNQHAKKTLVKKTNEYSLGEAIAEWAKKSGLQDELALNRIKYNWEEVAGKAIAAQTEAVWHKGRVWYLRISQPTWRDHLSYQREEIKKLINDEAGKIICDEVRII